jgi:tRNA(Ile)-lysidine synthase
MLRFFLDTIYSFGLFTKRSHLVVAASGGLDSTVLCECCQQAGFSFSIAHANFRLRGEESNRDEEFTRQLAGRYQVPFYVQKFETETWAAEHRVSIQEAARALRYEWFAGLLSEIRGKNNETFDRVRLLTAHHRDDSMETMLLNFFRGTGLRGLEGIPLENGDVCRPLLHVSRKEIRRFAGENNLRWMEDSSNAHSDYTRNFLRLEILPVLQRIYPNLQANLAGNLRRFQATGELYRLGTERILASLIRRKGMEERIPVKQLQQLPYAALLFEWLHPFGFTEKQVAEAEALMRAESGRFLVNPLGTYRLIRHRYWLLLSPASSESEHIVIEETDTVISFTPGELRLQPGETAPAKIRGGSYVAFLHAEKITYPLLLRKAKTGDYFYPFGQRKKKKLSRFFIDQKLSKAAKENAWVIEDADHRIIWVVGMRSDDRFRLEEGDPMLRLELIVKK